MFAESLLESNHPIQMRRGWTTLASLAIQAAALIALVAAPVLFPEALRLQARVPNPPTIFTPMVPERVHVEQSSSGRFGTFVGTRHGETTLLQPTGIPRRTNSDPGPEPSVCMVNCVSGDPNGNLLRAATAASPGPATVVTPERLRISAANPSTIIHRVQPVYPAIARPIRLQGDVILSAVISKAGIIESLQVVSGHPMLTQAALDAVKQWRYRPYLLNGQPVEVETQITVKFRIGQ